MKRNDLLLILLLILLSAGKNVAQNLTCVDFLTVALDQNCTHTVIPEEVLEGIQFPNCIVELDRVAPFGNGPWTTPVLGPADINKTYQVRVTHVPSGNKCWGNLMAEDKYPPVLKCNDVSTVDLNGGGPVTVATTSLSITAVDGCSTSTVTPASFQYDCTDLGINTVQLTASDIYGNTSTCQHTILVSNSASCQACVANCPQSVTVSYDEGNVDLLSAFQANDLSVFDVFGNALFDTGCTQLDSIYLVDYHPGTTGQSWFSRQWLWIDGGGQIVPCEQVIVFPSSRKVTVQGKVYLDASTDCNLDAGEAGVHIFDLMVTKLPSGVSSFITPNPDGTYSTDIVFGAQETSAELHLILPTGVNSVCPSALSIPNAASPLLYNFDIGLQSQGNCAVMAVNLGNSWLRKCSTNLFTLQYCNNGLDTAYGAVVTVDFDPLISLQTADFPYTVSGTDSLYTFEVGDIPPFQCGTIVIWATLSCDAQAGQTLCSEAHAYPDVPCGGAWPGAELVATAICSGDSVTLLLKNRGQQDMTQPLNYIVVEDFIMYKTDVFQLNAGDSIVVKVPANGSTWRIESPQEPGFQLSGLVAAAIEGCGGLNTPGLINIFGQSDEGPSYDQECSVVRASSDPNDKTAVPVGFGNDHIIRQNEPIEYKIRFQNTGNDTAFQVVIVDTLSALLDVRTLEVGASSHPYRLEIFPGGILHFVFNPIILPDSNINEVASHGFLQFRIGQQANLPDGSVIENTAAIYFDHNAPVFTNTAFHTVGNPIQQNPPLVLSSQTVAPTCNGSADGAIYSTVTGGQAPYTFLWNNPDWQGDTLIGLVAGTYQLTLTDSYGNSQVQSFDLVAPPAIELTLNSTPAVGTANNGTATAQATGGTGGFTYLWSNGAVTESVSALFPGTYTVVVTDAHGCTKSNSVAVIQIIVAPLTYSEQVQYPACNGGSDGSVTLTVVGGLMPYTYQWNDPNQQGNALTGLSAGTYMVTVTDAAGAQFEEVFVLTEPSAISIAMASTATLGNQSNGTASATPTGGTSAYSYLWSNGATSGNLSGLMAGAYTVVVTDAHGCTQSNSVGVAEIILTPLIYSEQILYPTCNGGSDGSVTLTVNGGLMPYTYQWSDLNLQGNALTGLSSGTYTVTVSDNAGSQFVETVVLTEPTALTVSMSSTPAFGNQNNGTASATVSGGVSAYKYLWSNGATAENLSGLAAGTYTVIVTDNNGCTQSSSVVVEQMVATLEPGLTHIQVWPNPAQDKVLLDLQEMLPQLLRLDVLGADGRLLQQIGASDLQPLHTLYLGNSPSSGIVLLVFYTREGHVITEKIMIR